MRYFALLSTLVWTTCLLGQENHSHGLGRAIYFPNIPGYVTVKADLHIHTVFSDGSVWPNIRIQEALRDSLDIVSMTEHIEYQPHRKDIPNPDFNRSYELASRSARPYSSLIVSSGTEITRALPPGHNNAIFIEDANKLIGLDSVEVFREANRQGAFVFWNHANWIAQQRDGIATLSEMQKMLIDEGLLHGIEVVNDLTYSAEALQIALDNDLTIMGTSDIHGLVDWQFGIPEGGHRPITLVFAEEKTEASIKEALMAGRTVAWTTNLLIGKEAYLQPLIEASLEVTKAQYQGIASVIDVMIKNNSEVDLILANEGKYTFHAHDDIVILKAHETTKVEVKTLEQLESFELPFRVMNGITAPKTHPVITIKVTVEK